MKVLSIRNPWGFVIGNGIKDVENRKQRTNYRGKVFIHAPAKWDDRFKEGTHGFTIPQWFSLPDDIRDVILSRRLIRSAIIGEFEIVDCVYGYSSIWSELECFQWVIKNGELYDEPVKDVRGKLGLWDLPKDIALKLFNQFNK